ncbi:MAG: hypothetical protein A7316_00240 [Candidatus Altiarchaeales archaeon WOR_SM1_86-2]|nr:MAG: hypothetical protein A7316_00240 [Candidatus Altiarchaeales archaeon WOR_SM1_86-2]ODS41735.1 MAG: hypothetical protein A7315_00440 [Candidatus Altiarchaeales archaeon WOR_SM1_79]
MCLAIPAKILSIEGNEALVDFGETKRKVRLDLVDADIGDWVIVHVGYAIEVMDEEAAMETLKYWEEYLSKVGGEV